MLSQASVLETAGPPRSANEEQRATVRHPSDGQATCHSPRSSAGAWQAGIHDVSTYGVALLLPGSVAAGTILEVDLDNHQGDAVRSVLVRVVHTEEAEAGVWVVGCAFIKELDDRELRAFQAYKLKPAAPDGRRWVRFPCNVETVCYTCEMIPGERHPARILNVSAGGIGLLLPCQFSGNTLLHLELPAEAARLALIRVVRIVEHASGGWFHGCEFVDQLGGDELQELLR